ncbi:AMP-binding protein [Streptomyces huasconensis]|uniref:AMP-binding protein n=1 Tax=Streptomyces huasconensis TaxID=1854574 RepID=UPI0036F95AC6
MSAKTLHSWFTDSVRRAPDREALVADGRTVSYAQLDYLSRELATSLSAAGVPRPLRVGLLAAAGVTAYAGYLGTLRVGGIVVPLPVDHPGERIRQVVELAALDVVLAEEGRDASFLDGTGVPVITVAGSRLRRALEEAPAVPGDPSDDKQDPDAVAYILFTSGSTGVPKGVPIRHRHLDAYLRLHIDRFQVGADCRVAQNIALTFDPSVLNTFIAWGGGATLVVPTRGELVDPVGFVGAHGLTHWMSVPSIVSLVRDAGALPPGSMPTLRHSYFGGEQLTLEQAQAWSDAAPNSTVDNLYGPTELAISVTAYRLPADRSAWPKTSNGTTPIGRIHPHLEHRIDPDTGELQVRGEQRFDGYLDPAANAGRFHDPVPHPGPEPSPQAWYRTGDRVTVEDGELVHMGRLDEQVKIMGQRLELGDVEAGIRQWGGVDDVVVTVAKAAGGQPRLLAVYSGAGTAPADLRARLRPHLPAHMLPTRFVQVDALPLNANGKVDRLACSRL